MSETVKKSGWGVDGDMIVEPPTAEVMRRIKAGEMPFTSRRIAVVEASAYLPEDEAKSIRELIAEAGTVLHTTGRTPRELAERVEQLEAERVECLSVLQAVKNEVNDLDMHLDGQQFDLFISVYEKLQAALARNGTE